MLLTPPSAPLEREHENTFARREMLLAALEHVRAQGGAPGVDGEDVGAFAARAAERCAELEETVLSGAYAAKPLRALRLPRHADARGRELLVPAVCDRVLQRAFIAHVAPMCEPLLHASSYAYREGRSCAAAVDVVRAALPRHPWVLDADVRDFFATVDHVLLEAQLHMWIEDPALVRLALEWVAAPVLRAGRIVARSSGLPIGAPVAPLLANIFLHPLDDALAGEQRTYVRFADDFVVCAKSRAHVQKLHHRAAETLAELGLRLNESKTRILDAREESFVFLGHLLRCGGPDGRALRTLDRPASRTLYVAEPGAQLVRRGNRLAVRRAGAEIVTVPLREVRDVVVLGACDLTAAAIAACAERGIAISILSMYGRWCGRFESWQSPHPALRQLQTLAALDAPIALGLARAFACGKLRNQRRLLQRAAARGGPPDALQTAAHGIGQALDVAAAATRGDELRGAEGRAAREFFAGLRTAIPAPWGFTGRVRRPPTDPINAMLSFGYTLLTSEAVSAVSQVGLDSYTGFLHQPCQGRHSLALDLVEEFRPLVVDTLVLSLVSRTILSPAHFVRDAATGGMLLRDDVRPIFLREYEQRMLTLFTYEPTGERVSYRRALILQAQQITRVLREPDSRYRPVLFT